MKKESISVIIFVLMVAGAIIMLLTSSPSLKQNLTELTIATPPSSGNGLLWVADNKSLFQKNGLNVSWIITADGITAAEQLQSGRAEVAVTTEFVPVYLKSISSSGSNILILSGLSSSEYCVLVARKDRGIIKPEDLAGKRAGAANNSLMEFFLSEYLKIHHLENKVTTLFTNSEDLDKKFYSGDLDAAVCPEQPLSRAEELFGSKNLTIFPVQDGTLTTFVLMVDSRWYALHQKESIALLKALHEAELAIGSDPDLIRVIMAKQFSYNPTSLAETKTHYHYMLSLDQSLISTMQEEQQWLIRKYRKNLTVSLIETIIETEPLSKVKPEGITLLRYIQ